VLENLGLAGSGSGLEGEAVRDKSGLAPRIQLASAGITGVKFLLVDFFDARRFPIQPLPFDPGPDYIPSTPSTLKSIEEAVVDVGMQLPMLTMRASETLVRLTDAVERFEGTIEPLVAKDGAVVKLLSQYEATGAEFQRLARSIDAEVQRARLGDTTAAMREAAASFTGLTADGALLVEDASGTVSALRDTLETVRELPDHREPAPSSIVRAGRHHCATGGRRREDEARRRRSRAARRGLRRAAARGRGALLRGRAPRTGRRRRPAPARERSGAAPAARDRGRLSALAHGLAARRRGRLPRPPALDRAAGELRGDATRRGPVRAPGSAARHAPVGAGARRGAAALRRGARARTRGRGLARRAAHGRRAGGDPRPHRQRAPADLGRLAGARRAGRGAVRATAARGREVAAARGARAEAEPDARRRPMPCALALLLGVAARANAQSVPPPDDEAQRIALLGRAARDGNLLQIGALLSRGTSVDARDRDGWTPLMHAAAAGRFEALQLLLQRGADARAKSERGDTALQLAAMREDARLTEALLAAGAPVGDVDAGGSTALMKAAARGHEGVAKALLAKGADPNRPDPSGASALILAALEGHDDVVGALPEAGADTEVRRRDGTLVVAAKQGRAAVVRELFDGKARSTPWRRPHHRVDPRGAQRRRRPGRCAAGRARTRIRGSGGETPLHAAARRGDAEIALRSSTPAVTSIANAAGLVPLVVALEEDHQDVARVYSGRSSGALFDEAFLAKRNADGRTPLSFAALAGLDKYTRALLDAGADLEAADAGGATPLLLAVISNHVDTAELLIDAGANVDASDVQARRR
jgi:ankyrin repeat protein